MRLAIPQAITIGISTATVLAAACSPLVKIDVQCDKLCLASPGPTLPGLSFFDAGTAVGPGAPVDAPSALDSAVLDAPTVELAVEERSVLDAVGRLALDAALPVIDATVAWLSTLEFNQV